MDAHRILAGAAETGDLEGLPDPAEEQLDRPAPPVEIGDFLGRGVPVVGQDAQHLARAGHDPPFAHRVRHRVAAAATLPRPKKTDAVGEDVAVGRARQLFDQVQRRVGFEAGDDAASGGIERGPPGIIVIAQIEDVGGARFDRHRLRHRDVVDGGGADRGIDRAIGGGVDPVHLGAAHPGRKAGQPALGSFSRTPVASIS